MCKKILCGALAAVSFFVIFTTCKIGLGESVDVTDPKIKITAPDTSSVVRGDINLKGTWTDDREVKQLTVKVVNVEHETTVISGAQAVVNADGTWDYLLYTQTSPVVPEGATVLADGKYEVKVVGYDIAGHSSGEASRAFEIDGTPPVVALSKPASINIDSPSTFGRIVKITGLISDDHGIAEMDITIWDEDGNQIPLSKSVFTGFDPSDTAIIIAKYLSPLQLENVDVNSDEYKLHLNYVSLYGEEGKEGWDTTKKYYADIKVLDRAGNTSEKTYLKTNMLKVVELATDGQTFEMADLKNILNGSYTGDVDTALITNILHGDYEAIDTDPKYAEYKDYYADLTVNKKLSFSINSNANPKYQISGNYTYDIETGKFNYAEKTSSLTIKVDSGRDGTEFRPSGLSVVITKLDNQYKPIPDTYKTIESDKIYNNSEPISGDSTPTQSGTYSINLTELSSWLEAGQCYRVEVLGSDLDGNPFDAESNNNYGFQCQVSATPATASYENNRGYVSVKDLNSAGKMNITVIDDNSESVITLKAKVKYYKDEKAQSIPSSEFNNEAVIYSKTLTGGALNPDNKAEYSVDLEGVRTNFKDWQAQNAASNYSIAVLITLEKAEANTTKEVFYLYVDNAVPNVSFINSNLDITASKITIKETDNYYDAENKTYTIRGKWDDMQNSVAGSGATELYYTFAASPDKGTASQWNQIEKVEADYAIQNSTNWEIAIANKTGETGISIDDDKDIIEGEKKLSFFAKDAVGNTTDIITFNKIIFDFGNPELNITEGTFPEYVKKNGKISVKGNYKDNYGIKEFKVIAKLDGSVVASGAKGYTLTNTPSGDKAGAFTIEVIQLEDGSNDGKWTFDISVTDNADRVTKLSGTSIIDTNKPEWKEDTFTVNKTPYSYSSQTEHTWYKSSALPFAGSLIENGSGIEEIKYSVIQAGSEAEPTYADSFVTTKNDDGTESFSVNLGEFITKVKDGNAVSNDVYIKAVDCAGNESNSYTFHIYIDAEAPTFTVDQKETQVTNGVQNVKASGTFDDDASGVNNVSLEVSYTEDNVKKIVIIDGKELVPTTLNYLNKTWSYDIPANKLTLDTSYSVKAVVEDNAGNKTSLTVFNIQRDSECPIFKTYSVETTSTKYSVYSSADKTYFVNNSDGKFTISGITNDNFGIDKVDLLITGNKGSESVEYSDTQSTTSVYSFENINLKDWTGTANATLTVTDKAGNINADPLVLILNFDTSAPKGLHAVDANGKDLFFRLGENNNDEPATLDDFDKDVGGKYSTTTYGSAETIIVRGSFDDASGSGVEKIYYYIASTKSIADGVTAENYKDYTTSYFTPIVETPAKTVEQQAKRRVYYTDYSGSQSTNGTLYDPDSTGTPKYNTAVTPPAEGNLGNNKYWTYINSTYKTTITGFTPNEENYLVLIVVDKVGNAAVDGVQMVIPGETPPTTYTNYLINIDNKVPTISPSTQFTSSYIYINGQSAVEIDGIAEDDGAGINTMEVTVNGKTITKSSSADGVIYLANSGTVTDLAGNTVAGLSERKTYWKLIINPAVFSSATSGNIPVYIKAIDKAGSGNSATENVMMTLDNVGPETVTINDVPNAGTEKIGEDDVPVINSTLTIKGSASDNLSGLKESTALILYYTRKASPSKPTADTIGTSASQADSKWIKYEPASGFGGNQSASWEFKVDTTQFTDEKVTYFCFAATDKVDNIGYSNPYRVKINQDSDRPVIKFTNLTLSDSITLDNSELYGSISDDDGIPESDSVWYYVVNTKLNPTWSVPAESSTSWIAPLSNSDFTYDNGSFTLKLSDGPKAICFKIRAGDKTYITSKDTTFNTLLPKVTDKSNTIYGEKPASGTTTQKTVINVRVDTTEPETINRKYWQNAEDGWKDDIDSVIFGGTKNIFKLRLYAYDDNDVQTITLKIPKGANDNVSASTAGDYYVYNFTKQSDTITVGSKTYTQWLCEDINVMGMAADSGAESSQRSCSIYTSDGVKEKKEIFNLHIDNVPPEATFTSHKEDAQIRAAFILKGGFKYGDVDTTLKYIYSSSATPPDVDATEWNSRDTVEAVTSMSWLINFDGGTTAEETHDVLPKELVANILSYVEISTAEATKGKAVYKTDRGEHKAGDLFREITTVYFHLLAIDGLGNKSVKTFHLRIDPQGDVPTIEMSSPAVEVYDGTHKKYGWYTSDSGVEETERWIYTDEPAEKWGETKTQGGHTYKYVGGTTKMSGIIRAQGSAEDDKEIVGIYMQIDPQFNPTSGFSSTWNTKNCPGTGKKLEESGYVVEDMYTAYNTHKGLNPGDTGYKSDGPQGIKVGTKASWNINLNSRNEFNVEDDKNYIAIRYYAIDEDGNISDWNDKDLFIVTVDADAPKIGSSEPLYLYQYRFKENSTGTYYYAKFVTVTESAGTKTYEVDDGGKLYEDPGCNTVATGKTYTTATASSYTPAIVSQQYSESMWLNGEWWLSGSVEDESGINEVTVNNSSIKASSKAKTWDGGNLKGYVINFRVGSNDKTSPGYGDLSYKIWVQDDTQNDTKKEAELEIKIRYDNKAPTLADSTDDAYRISTDVVNSSGFYTVESAVTENDKESGFDKVIFYFTRGNTVYDSYMPKGYGNEISSGWVSDSNIYWKTNTVTAVNDRIITVTADQNIHRGGLAKIGGIIYRIENVSGGSVTLDGTPSPSVVGEQALFAIGHVVEHVGSENIGKKADIYTDSTKYGYGYYPDGSDGDGDLMVEKVSTVSNKTTWSGSINSRNIPDGSVTIHYVAFDTAGNYSYGKVENAKVKNNAPRIASLKVWTDYNGNGTEDANESDTKFYKGKDRKVSGNNVERATDITDNFVVSGNDKDYTETAATPFKRLTDLTRFYPEIVGGNGNLYYSYRIGAGTNPDDWTTKGNSKTTPFSTATNRKESGEASLYTVTDDRGDSYVSGDASKKIEVGTSLLTSVGNGAKWFEYTIWDSTEGKTPFDNSGDQINETLNAKFVVLLNVAYADTSAPKAVISPFYWNSLNDNSIYGSADTDEVTDFNDLQGHIELVDDLTTQTAETTDGTTALGGDDPKVSGKIIIHGTAYDDIRLSQLWIKFDDITLSGGKTGTNPDASGHPDYVLAATYDKTKTAPAEKWSLATAAMAEQGWEFTVVDEYCDTNGHKVNWELSINTANVTNVAALDKKAYVMAVAERGSGANKYSAATPSVTEAGDINVYNNPFYKMDIVPYVTKLSTASKQVNSGLKDSNIRSASGKYSIIKGSTANFITVTGFNLNPGTAEVRIVKEAVAKSATDSSAIGTELTRSAADATHTSFGISNDISYSGYLEVFTNGIRALNNINENDAYGTATKTVNKQDVPITGGASGNATVNDYKYAYNREADYITTKNVQLTDDRYLRVFEMHDTKINNGYYPVMEMEDGNPVFGYIDNNGGGTDVSGAPAANAFYQRAKYTLNTGNNDYKEYLGKSLVGDQMAMVKDGGNRYIHVSVSNYSGDYMTIYYDRFSELHDSNVWNGVTAYTSLTGMRGTEGSNNAIAIDSVEKKTGRFQYPKLFSKGNSITGSASIYMAYYDGSNSKIYIRDFMIGNTSGTGWYQLDSTGEDHNGNPFKQYVNFAESTTNLNTRHTLKTKVDDVETDVKGSKYYDMVVTNDNHIVIVYYDESNTKLKLLYSTAAVTGTSPRADIAWTESPVNFPDYVGNYVSMTLDSKGGIHISAFDVTDSDLSYVYLSSYDATSCTHRTVDQFGAVGNWTKIKVNSSNVPYIAYTNATENGQRDAIKLAVSDAAAGSVEAGVDSKKYTTGHWEYMTVPAITPPQGNDTKFQSVCLGFSGTKPVVGYLGNNIEYGYWLDEAN